MHIFLVFAFRDARFLSGLYGRFSYIVAPLYVPSYMYFLTEAKHPTRVLCSRIGGDMLRFRGKEVW